MISHSFPSFSLNRFSLLSLPNTSNSNPSHSSLLFRSQDPCFSFGMILSSSLSCILMIFDLTFGVLKLVENFQNF